MSNTTCVDCGLELQDDPEGAPRTPCPDCGSTRRNVSMTLESSLVVHAEFAPIQATVVRSLNDTRLAVLGILVAIGVSVGFGVAPPAWAGVLVGVGSVVAFGALIKWRASQRRLMALMHWLTGA